MFSLRPCSDASSGWHDFRIYSVTGTDNWTEHCRGLLSIEQGGQGGDDGDDEARAWHEAAITDIEAQCSKDVDVKALYRDLDAAGLQYGPSFAIMSRARAGPYKSVGDITVHDTAEMMPSNFQHPFVVHPATLDGCIQVLFPGMAEAEGPIQQAMMPTSIEEIFVSAKISRKPNHEFRVFANSERTSATKTASSIVVVDQGSADAEPMITLKGLVCSSLPRISADKGSEDSGKLCHRTEWAPAPNFLSSEQIATVCQESVVAGTYGPAAAYIDLLAHQNPYLECLELDAGIGDVTLPILQVLGGCSDDDAPRFSSYDVVTNDADEVQAKVGAWGELVSSRNEADAFKDFEGRTYDVVIARGKAGMGATLGRLLKPEGKLLLVGQDDGRDELLTQARLSKLAETTTHGEEPIKLTIAQSVAGASKYPDVLIISDGETSDLSLTSLQSWLEDLGVKTSTTTMADANPAGKACIVTGEVTGTLLSAPTPSQLQSIQRVLSESDGTLWVTRGATVDSELPDRNLIAGLARTVRLESTSTVVTLDLDGKALLGAEASARTVFDVFERTFALDRNVARLDMEYSERMGVIMVPRIVENAELNDFVSLTLREQESQANLFRPDASYLLIGGLGGLGRSIATWMVSRGARNIVFASRSGHDSSERTEQLLSSLRAAGATTMVSKCDIADASELDRLLVEAARQGMPTIKGVINAAMAIKNAFFQHVTLDDYSASLAPKVQGTWNLHRRFAPPSATPDEAGAAGLDFLILLSSAVGTIGNASQAAYAAAASFQDALAQHRAARNLPCVSLALGMVDGVGYVAENASVRDGLERMGFRGVGEREVLAMVEDAVRRPLRSAKTATVISGLGSWSLAERSCSAPALADQRLAVFRRAGDFRSSKQDPSAADPTGAADGAACLRALLSSWTVTAAEAGAALKTALRRRLASLVMVPDEDTSELRSMADQGLDSLVAVQLRAWIVQSTGVTVGVLELLGGASLGEFAEGLVERARKG
jgi:NAD(P)-dependent dehydrogenase (short-subunit alcohol dehydrogenase family)